MDFHPCHPGTPSHRRRRNIRLHQRRFIGTYTGLLVAGIFALAPWRPLGHLVWHAANLA